MNRLNRNYIFFGVIVLFAIAVAFLALYYRGTLLQRTRQNVGLVQNVSISSSSLALPDVNGSTTIKDVERMALKFNTEGKLFLTWTRLDNNTYEVRIFRAKRGGKMWELWKTLSVHGAPGTSTEIAITRDEERTLLDYNYFFESRGQDGKTIDVSTVLSFAGARWDATGELTTIATTQIIPPAIVAQLGEVIKPGDTIVIPINTPPAPAPAPTAPPTGDATPANPPAPPVSTPPQGASGPRYTVYFYTPDGRISSTSTFPAPDQNFWVENQGGKIELGWQGLATTTAEVVISRSENSTGPWESFFRQQRPVLDRPYSVFLNDIGTTAPYYYRLETFDGASTLLASYGPMYLDPTR